MRNSERLSSLQVRDGDMVMMASVYVALFLSSFSFYYLCNMLIPFHLCLEVYFMNSNTYNLYHFTSVVHVRDFRVDEL